MVLPGFRSPQSNPVCRLPKAQGPCDGSFRAFYYDTARHRCRPFHYSGCSGNDNRFTTMADCRRTCHLSRRRVRSPLPTRAPFTVGPFLSSDSDCNMPPSLGRCGRLERGWGPTRASSFFYNTHTGQCEWFAYTGCGHQWSLSAEVHVGGGSR